MTGEQQLAGERRPSPHVLLGAAIAMIVVASTLALSASAATTGILFSDGFEAGNLNLWNGKAGFVAQQQEVYAGAWAARGTSTGAAAYAYEALNPTRTDLYVDVRFKIISQGNMNVGLVRFRTSTAGAIFSIMRRNDGRLFYYNEVTGVGTASSVAITTGAWHELEIHGLINGTSGKDEVWFDGAFVTSISKTDNLGTAPFGRVYLGDPAADKTWDVAYDAVIFSTAFDVAPPSVPGSLSGSAPGPNEVDLSWSPSVDNVAVTGYTVFRDGVAVGTAGGSATTYADTTVSPNTTYTYTVDAFDAQDNHSAPSNPATVTTPAVIDTIPPTVPTNLIATASAPNRVDLMWTASTDNVAVVGYTIYRGGTLLTQVGTATVYSDTSVAANTSYVYTVDAFDAAGNHSAQSVSASVTTPGLVFADGFEGGNLNSWTGNTGMVAQQQEVHTGGWAARGTSTGAPVYAYELLFPTQKDLYTDLFFKVMSQGNAHVGLVRFRTSSVGAIFSIMRKSDGRLLYYNEVTGASTTSATSISTGVWHELKVHGRINGTAGQVEVWLDGTRLSDVSKIDNLGTSAIGRVYLADPGSAKTWDVVFDDVVMSTATDVTPPTPPTGLTATVVGSNHVNLSWTPATDQSGVSTYTVYRGGVAIGTIGGVATQYADFGAPSSAMSTYTVDALDPAGNRSVQSSPATATTGAQTGGDPMIIAVGDIACDPGNGWFNNGSGTATDCRQRYTSDIAFGSNEAAILALGDTQYEDGALSKFLASYDPSWGRVRSITHPAPGNHEYLTGAAGYFAYFGAAAGDPAKGYYSFDVGSWHIIMLNDACASIGGCVPSSPQGQWLAADMAAHQNTCTLAAWHAPTFSSGFHGNNNDLVTFWQQLYAGGVDVVLSGHDHDYERFAPQNPSQQADPLGIRSFVVGTGGDEHEGLTVIQPNSEVINNDTYGVLELTLHPSGYDWSFVPEAGRTFTDAGSDSCH